MHLGRYTAIVPVPSEQDQLERHFDPVPLPSVIYRQTRHVRTTAEPQPNYSQKRMKSAEPQPSNSPAAKNFYRLILNAPYLRHRSKTTRKQKTFTELAPKTLYLRYSSKEPIGEKLLLTYLKCNFSQT